MNARELASKSAVERTSFMVESDCCKTIELSVHVDIYISSSRRIWGFHGDDDDDECIVRRDVVTRDVEHVSRKQYRNDFLSHTVILPYP